MSSSSTLLSQQVRPAESTPQSHTIPEGILLGGPSDLEVVEILQDLIDPVEETRNVNSPALAWYKRPSPAWLLYGTLIGAISMSSTLAPRVEVYIKLACQEIRPEYNLVGRTVGGVIEWPSNIGAMTMPRPSAKCQADPEVQQAVAELGATIITIMGTLSCLTAGWWGKFSDYYGRTKVMAFTVLGALATDLGTILVALASDHLPGGYRFLMVSAIVEGILGGLATGSAATHAYLSDTTTPANRSRIFSLILGLLFTGVAVGPTLGGLLISWTHNLLSVFLMAALFHGLYVILLLFVVPESLTKEMAKANAEIAKRRFEQEEARRAANPKPATAIRKAKHILRKAFFFLSPLSIFIPPKTRRGQGRSWNLTILAITYGLYSMLFGSYQFKYQYATYEFGWTSHQLGYWLSVLGIMRAIHLIAVLPIIIKVFQPVSRPSLVANGENRGGRSQSPRYRGLPHDPKFDLIIARASLCMELLQYILATLSPNATIWIAATMIGSFGGGLSPSIQALSVELSRSKDSALHNGGQTTENYGHLFGAIAVVNAFSSQMLGPTVFGTIFVQTIHRFPKAIFVAGGVVIVVGLLCLSLIHIPKGHAGDEEREPLLPEGGE